MDDEGRDVAETAGVKEINREQATVRSRILRMVMVLKMFTVSPGGRKGL